MVAAATQIVFQGDQLVIEDEARWRYADMVVAVLTTIQPYVNCQHAQPSEPRQKTRQ